MSLAIKFSEDNTAKFIEFFSVSSDVESLLSWIHAPKNLQQFRPVIANLIRVLSVQLAPRLLNELGITAEQLSAWRDLLCSMQEMLPDVFPRQLRVLENNANVRPHGLIGEFPIYASLVGADFSYNEEHTENILTMHLIALAAASAYQNKINSNEIQNPTTGIAAGMREIRQLEKSSYDSSELPDLRNLSSLAEVIDTVSQYIEVLSVGNDDLERVWGQNFRLLLRSFDEQRESTKRGFTPKNQHTFTTKKVLKEVHDDDDDDDTAAGVTIEFEIITPDAKSAAQLASTGLHPYEMNQVVSVSINDPDASDLVKNDARLNSKRHRGRIQGLRQAAQELRCDWSKPTETEIGFLLRLITGELVLPVLEKVGFWRDPELNVLLLLRALTGRSISELLSFRFIDKKEDYLRLKKPVIAFIANSQELALPLQATATNKNINASDRYLLASEPFNQTNIKQQETIFLKLSEASTAVLNSNAEWYLNNTRHNPKSIAFKLPEESYRNSISEYFKYINKRYAMRWSNQRLSKIMRTALLHCNADQVFVHLITQQDIGHAVVASHYQKTAVTRLDDIVKEAHNWISSCAQEKSQHPVKLIELTDKPLSQVSLGTESAVPDLFVKELCEHLKLKLKMHKKRSNEENSLIEVHNALVVYIVTWLGFSSGYRAVFDPLSDPRHLDKKTGAIVISDKDNEVNTHSRIVNVSECFVQQIDMYVEHLNSLANKLGAKPALQSDIRCLCHRYWAFDTDTNELSIPFLFLLSDSLRARSVSPGALSEYMPVKLPQNFNRHYLRSKLSELNASSESISYFMGHWQYGEEPYQKYSSISVHDIALELKDAFKAIQSAAGWSVQQGLNFG